MAKVFRGFKKRGRPKSVDAGATPNPDGNGSAGNIEDDDNSTDDASEFSSSPDSGGFGEPPIVNPGELTGDQSGDALPKRRGRKPGTKNKSKNQTSLAVNIAGIRSILAAGFDCEELELDEKEANVYADALSNLQEHYPLTIISEKALAWVGLITAIVSIEGPRALAIKKRLKGKKGNKQPVIVMQEPAPMVN